MEADEAEKGSSKKYSNRKYRMEKDFFRKNRKSESSAKIEKSGELAEGPKSSQSSDEGEMHESASAPAPEDASTGSAEEKATPTVTNAERFTQLITE